MNEGPIWVWSTIRTSRNQNASSWEDFKQQVRLNLCDCGNTQASNPGVNKKWRWPTWEPYPANSINGTEGCSLTLGYCRKISNFVTMKQWPSG